MNKAWFFIFLSLLSVSSAMAQDKYPSRPIVVVIPYGVGTTTDLIARSFAPKLSERLGQSVVVQNRPGAGGTIGTHSVATSAPDGYTLLMANSTHAINPALYSKLPFDSRRDFSGVALVAESAYLIVVPPQLGVRTLKEFVNLAKSKPGTTNYASAGIGTSTHLAAAYFSSLAGIELVHVPYKNTPDYIADLLSGRVQVTFVPTAFLLSQIKEGKLLALAVSTPEPMRTPLEVPSARAANVNYDYSVWFGVLAPSKVPSPVLDALGKAIAYAQQHPDVHADFARLGIAARTMAREKFDTLIREEMDRLAPLVKASGARAD